METDTSCKCKWNIGVATHISDKMDFKTGHREGRCIKGAIQQENITLVNLPYIKQVLMDIKGEISSNTVIVGGFNISFTSMNRPFR